MFGTNTISWLYDAALAVAYPQVCAVCDGSVESRFDGVACAACWEETRVFTAHDTLCWKCGALALGSIAEERREEVRCHRCDDAVFTAARACGLYHGALRAAIIELKRAPHVPRRLAQLMVETCLRPPLDRSTLILAVPLHPQREKERGFNQALVLAHELSYVTRLPVAENCLVRVAHTERHRAGMDAQARRESVEDVFALMTPRTIEGENILLIDDVFTTGATISACAVVLRAAGAKEVFALTLARPLSG
jgi:competence protein ComFC